MRMIKNKIGLLILFIMTFIAMGKPSQTVMASEYNKAYVVIEKFEVSDGAVIPGEEFDLTLTLKNTSTLNNVGSTMVTFASADKMVHMVDGKAAQFYIDGLYVQQEIQVTLRLEAEEALQTTTTPIDFQFVYSDQESYANQNQVEIALPVSTKGHLNVKGYSVPDTALKGTQTRISANFKNTGQDTLSNVVMNITGEGLEEEIHYEVTSLVGGDQNYAEVYVIFPEVGTQKINLNFSYTDTDGSILETEKVEYKVEVQGEQEAGTEAVQPTEGTAVGTSGGALSLVVKGILMLAIIGLLALAFMVYRKDMR